MAETSQYISSFGNDFETEALPKAFATGHEQSAKMQLWTIW